MSVILLATAPAWGQAQQVGGIRGFATDRNFDVPVADVQVTIAETGRRVLTQQEGNYVFPELPAGTYTLIFSKEGFARQVKSNVVVTGGSLTEVDVSLPNEFNEMDDMVVQDLPMEAAQPLVVAPPPMSSEQGLLDLRQKVPAVTDSIGAQLMQRAGASNAVDAIKYVAGASVQDGKYAVVRGLPDRYVNSQMNGVRLPTADLDKRAVQLDQFPAAVIESIQISKTFTPDQQGDASGGVVNVLLRGVPHETFLTFSAQTTYNTQTTGRSDFLTYRGGGVSVLGFDNGGRDIPPVFLTPAGGSSTDAIGVTTREAPLNSKWNLGVGIQKKLDTDYTIGGLFNANYERTSLSYRNGRDDNYVIDGSGNVIPAGFIPDPSEPQSLHLYDVNRSTQEVKWSTLTTLGIDSKEQALSFVHLYTRSAEDSATLTQDVRGKQYVFPGFDPNDQNSPGYTDFTTAPYLRGETLTYRERSTQTMQFHGRHVIPLADFGIRDLLVFSAPEFDWTFALSDSTLDEPDKRLFGTQWTPEYVVDMGPGNPPFIIDPTHAPYRPGTSNINIGTAQRIWKSVEEDSTQYFMNLKYPFKQWTGSDGYFKFGVFNDDVKREYRQESFSNAGELVSGPRYIGPFEDNWSAHYPYENHIFTAGETDANYDGKQKISAFYWMVDMPLTTELNLIGGFRYEKTKLDTVIIDPEEFVFWVPPGSSSFVELNPGDADVHFRQDDVLPSIGLVYRPMKELTLRMNYAETTARQTFKELTPIQQSEYLGAPVFVGNPFLKMSSLRNYDLRLDYVPQEGALMSVSYFYKDVRDPIEYVQKSVGFTYTTAENYPKGNLSGIELEIRQDLGKIWKDCYGLTVGGNATLISSEVTLPASEANQFIPPLKSRDMTNAPAYLYNLYANYDIKESGTSVSLFYSVRGDTLVAGAGSGGGGYIPSVYETDIGTLNLSISQKIGKYLNITFQAKNLTNSPVRTVYRADTLGQDVLKTTYTKGIDLQLSIGGKFEF